MMMMVIHNVNQVWAFHFCLFFNSYSADGVFYLLFPSVSNYSKLNIFWSAGQMKSIFRTLITLGSDNLINKIIIISMTSFQIQARDLPVFHCFEYIFF